MYMYLLLVQYTCKCCMMKETEPVDKLEREL